MQAFGHGAVMSALKYRPEIDGLRAIAVLPVILFHLGIGWIPGGFVGVDVFFVISGYLITTIIVQERDQGRFKFSHFWLRRLRRIFPALAVMVLGTSVLAGMQIIRCDENDVGKEGISAILSFANITMWQMPGGYWGANAENSLFLHTWSLSVEEQFYFLYPFILIALLKLGRRWTLRAMVGLAVASFGLYVYGSATHPTATFYLLPTRAWELATGCILAIAASNYSKNVSPAVCSAFSFVGLTAIAASCLVFWPPNRIGGCLVVPVAGAALVIWFGNNPVNAANGVLSYRPMVLIGKMSYSLYLWHWPISILARQRGLLDDGYAGLFMVLAIIALVSSASYYCIERPARGLTHILVPASVALVACLSTSIALYRSTNSPDLSAFSEVVWNGELYNVGLNDNWPDHVRKRMKGIVVPKRANPDASAYLSGGVIKQYGRSEPEIVLLGDSHALMWAGVVDNICRDLKITVSFYAADGETPFVRMPVTRETRTKGFSFSKEERYLYDSKRLQYLAKWRPRLVILVARWAELKGKTKPDDLIRFIGEQGSQVLFIDSPPELSIGDTNALRFVASSSVSPGIGDLQFVKNSGRRNYDEGRELLTHLCREYPFCGIVSIADLFCDRGSGVCIREGFDVLYIDDHHLSLAGALRCQNAIRRSIEEALTK
jgi:peptidoglycan/LPS O-acetylase OafA/YrhL